jgi:hypothetical protein
MSESAEREPEPELAFLEGIEREPADLDAGELDELFEGVRDQVEKSGARRLNALAEQPTHRRRLFALACFALIVVGLGALLPHSNEPLPPLALAAIFGSFGVLLLLAVLVAFRPIYVPALSPVWKIGLGVVAIAAAVAVALVPELHAHLTARPPEDALLGRALPCLTMGLLAGLPGYAFLRLLDRGAPFGRLLAGVAAGLAANMVLELRCPVGGTEHLMFGHAMVVVLFVVGVVLVERLIVRGLAKRS